MIKSVYSNMMFHGPEPNHQGSINWHILSSEINFFCQNEICNPWNKLWKTWTYLRRRIKWCKTCLMLVAFPFFLVSLRQEFQTWIVKKTHWSLETFVFAKSFSIFLDECYNSNKKYIWQKFYKFSGSFSHRKVLKILEDFAKWVERSEMTEETLPRRNYNSTVRLKFKEKQHPKGVDPNVVTKNLNVVQNLSPTDWQSYDETIKICI